MALFPTGLTMLRALAVARWLAWGWMVAVVAFSGDAIRQPFVAWASVVVAFALAAASTWLVRTDPQRLDERRLPRRRGRRSPSG